MELKNNHGRYEAGPALRLVNAGHNTMPTGNADGFSDAPQMLQTDPRWVAAARIQGMIQGQREDQLLSRLESHHTKMAEVCTNAGFAPVHAQAMIQIVQRAQTRGGLDQPAMDELTQIPSREAIKKMQSQKMLFTALIAWSMCIAGIMVLALRFV